MRRQAVTTPNNVTTPLELFLPAGRVYAVTCGHRMILCLHALMINGGRSHAGQEEQMQIAGVDIYVNHPVLHLEATDWVPLSLALDAAPRSQLKPTWRSGFDPRGG
jgi:hypothetical protein